MRRPAGGGKSGSGDQPGSNESMERLPVTGRRVREKKILAGNRYGTVQCAHDQGVREKKKREAP